MGRRLAVCPLILFTAGVWLAAGINRWTTSGPYGGQILFLAIDPQTPNVLYTGVLYGGFFRSRNWGQSWEEYSGFTSPVFACAVHPADHNVVLASSYEAVFRSTDAGDSWIQVCSTGRMRAFAIPPTRPDTVYAGGMNGFWRSTDRGQAWTKTATLAGVQIDDISLPPGYPDTVYLGTWSSGVLRSTDGGFSWTTLFSPTGLGYRVACHPDRPGWIYASVYDPTGIYRSTNGGSSWTQLSNSKYFEEVAFDPVNPDRIYFIGLYGCYLSTNAGQTSTAVDPLGGRAVALDRTAPDGALYFGTLSGVRRSWDGGGTFRNASAGLLSHTWALAVSPTAPGTVYAGDDTSNLFLSRDSGESWQPLSDVTDFPSMQTGLVTTILGEQWSYLAMGFKGLTLTAATSPPTLFGTVNGDLFRSTNEGTSWSLALANKILWDVRTDPTNPSRLYAASGWVGWTYSFTGIHRSTNGGVNWTATGQLLNTNISELLIDPQTPQTLYAAGDSGLFKSTDSGAGWGSITTGLGDTHVYSLARDVSSPAFLFAGTGNAGVYRSSNAGGNWTYSGLSGDRVYALGSETVSNAVYAGKWPGLYVSTNSGSTWGLSSPDLAESNVRDIATDSRGAAGQFRQENTQFFGDLRGYDFTAQQGVLAVNLRAFYQKTGVPVSTGFSQNPVSLFRLDLDRSDEYANNVLYGAVVIDSAVADLDGDGREDLVSIDRNLHRVYWVLENDGRSMRIPIRKLLAVIRGSPSAVRNPRRGGYPASDNRKKPECAKWNQATFAKITRWIYRVHV